MGDLFPPVGRETMHHHRIPSRHGDYTFVNLIALEGPASAFQLPFLSHARPHIGVDHIGRLHRLLHLMGHNDLSSVLLCGTCDLCVRLVAFGTGKGKGE